MEIKEIIFFSIAENLSVRVFAKEKSSSLPKQ